MMAFNQTPLSTFDEMSTNTQLSHIPPLMLQDRSTDKTLRRQHIPRSVSLCPPLYHLALSLLYVSIARFPA